MFNAQARNPKHNLLLLLYIQCIQFTAPIGNLDLRNCNLLSVTVSYIAQNNFIYFQLMNLQPDILPQYRQVTGNAAF